MDFVTPLYKTLEAQATLDQAKATAIDTRALADLRQQNVLLGNIKMQQTINTQEALQQAVQGNVFDPSLEPSPDDSAVDATRKNAMRAAQQAQFSRRAAQKILQSGGDPAVARQYMQEADTAGWRSAQAQREALTEQKNLVGQLASVAGTATNDDTADAAYQQMISIAPKIAQTMTFDRDPTNGKVVMGDQTKRNFDILKAAGITAEQQIQNQQKVQAELDRQRNQARLEAQEKSREQVDAARVANLQAGTKLHQAQTAKILKGEPTKLVTASAATNSQKDSAMDNITSRDEFKDAKFDGSLIAFAADVADRANEIRAEAHNAGKADIGLDDARQMAIDQLKDYVTDKTTKKEKWFGLSSDESTLKTYTRRGQQASAAPAAGGPPEIKSQTDYDALPKGTTYIWNGKQAIKK